MNFRNFVKRPTTFGVTGAVGLVIGTFIRRWGDYSIAESTG